MENVQIIRYISGLLNKSELTESEEKEVLINAEVMGYIITKTNSKTFNIIMNLLGNPNEYIEQRKLLEQNAINNIANVDITQRKDVISQIYFGDYATNFVLTIETILERIDSNSNFKSNFDDNIINFLRNLQTFLRKDDIVDFTDFIKKIDLFQEEARNTVATLVEKMFLLAQKDFLDEVKTSLNASNIFEGITPSIMKSKSGKSVQLYSLQNQTD